MVMICLGFDYYYDKQAKCFYKLNKGDLTEISSVIIGRSSKPSHLQTIFDLLIENPGTPVPNKKLVIEGKDSKTYDSSIDDAALSKSITMLRKKLEKMCPGLGKQIISVPVTTRTPSGSKKTKCYMYQIPKDDTYTSKQSADISDEMKEMLEKLEHYTEQEIRNYQPDQQIIPQVITGNGQFDNIYDLIIDVSQKHSHVFMYGTGDGKSNLAAYACQKALSAQDFYPVYIDAKKIRKTANTSEGIIGYLSEHTGSNPSDLRTFFEQINRNILIILDNIEWLYIPKSNTELNISITDDLDKLMQNLHITICMIGRNQYDLFSSLEGKFCFAEIQRLTAGQVISYLSKKGIHTDMIEHNIPLLSILRNVEFLRMYDEEDSQIADPADIIRSYIRKKVRLTEHVQPFVIEILLPIVAAYITLESDDPFSLKYREIKDALGITSIDLLYDIQNGEMESQYWLSGDEIDLLLDKNAYDQIIEQGQLIGIMKDSEEGIQWKSVTIQNYFAALGVFLLHHYHHTNADRYLEALNSSMIQSRKALSSYSANNVGLYFYLLWRNESSSKKNRCTLPVLNIIYDVNWYADTTRQSYIIYISSLDLFELMTENWYDPLTYIERKGTAAYTMMHTSSLFDDEPAKFMKVLETSKSALEDCLKELAQIPESTDKKVISAKIYSNAGAYYLSMQRLMSEINMPRYSVDNELQSAMENHQRACAIRENLCTIYPEQSGYKLLLARSYANLGTVYFYMHDFKTAESYQEKAYEIRTQLQAAEEISASKIRRSGAAVRTGELDKKRLLGIFSDLKHALDYIVEKFRIGELENLTNTFKDCLCYGCEILSSDDEVLASARQLAKIIDDSYFSLTWRPGGCTTYLNTLTEMITITSALSDPYDRCFRLAEWVVSPASEQLIRIYEGNEKAELVASARKDLSAIKDKRKAAQMIYALLCSIDDPTTPMDYRSRVRAVHTWLSHLVTAGEMDETDTASFREYKAYLNNLIGDHLGINDTIYPTANSLMNDKTSNRFNYMLNATKLGERYAVFDFGMEKEHSDEIQNALKRLGFFQTETEAEKEIISLPDLDAIIICGGTYEANIKRTDYAANVISYARSANIKVIALSAVRRINAAEIQPDEASEYGETEYDQLSCCMERIFSLDPSQTETDTITSDDHLYRILHKKWNSNYWLLEVEPLYKETRATTIDTIKALDTVYSLKNKNIALITTDIYRQWIYIQTSSEIEQQYNTNIYVISKGGVQKSRPVSRIVQEYKTVLDQLKKYYQNIETIMKE